MPTSCGRIDISQLAYLFKSGNNTISVSGNNIMVVIAKSDSRGISCALPTPCGNTSVVVCRYVCIILPSIVYAGRNSSRVMVSTWKFDTKTWLTWLQHTYMKCSQQKNTVSKNFVWTEIVRFIIFAIAGK